MEEKEISDIKKVENVFTESSEKKQASSFLPSCVKSCSSTQIESTTFDFSWKIDQFWFVHKTIDTLYSPPFPENGENKIQMNIIRKSTPPRDISLRFYMCTSKAFIGSCYTVIDLPKEFKYTNLGSITKWISGRITDMTLLIESSKYQQYVLNGMFTIHFKFEIFQRIISNAIHMNLLPPSTLYSKDLKSEDSPFDQFEPKNGGNSIKFIIGEEQYVIPKKLLYATNSSYFKNMCLTHNEDEENLTDELITYYEICAFKYLLLFILTGSIKEIQDSYNMLEQLLIIANKYDVLSLKLMCEHYLLRRITIENAVELMQLAISTNAKFLESHSATFLKFYKNEIVNTKKFQDLSQEDSYKIMELIEKSEILEISSLHKFVDFVITE